MAGSLLIQHGSYQWISREDQPGIEFREQLVKLHRAGRSIPELAREFAPTPWSIALWVKQSDRAAGRGDGGLTTSEREELAQLRRENERLKMEREILAKATWHV